MKPKKLLVDAEAVLGDLLAGRLVLRSCRPEYRSTISSMLTVIASTALHDLVAAGEIDRDGDLLAQLDAAGVFLEVALDSAGRPAVRA